MAKLTKKHLDAMKLITEGADVCSPILAATLREVEKLHPELITICRPMGQYKVSQKLPYFGAILTLAGREVLWSSKKPNRNAARLLRSSRS